MKLVSSILLSCMVLSAHAHGPTPQKTDESVLVHAAPAAVWKTLSTICSVKDWHPEVTDCKASDDQKSRILTLKNGATLEEGIDEVADAEMSISYRLGNEVDIKALPVSSLNGRIKVEAEEGGSRVSWMARYYRVDTTNEPLEGLDDAAATKAVTAYIRTGLAGLEHPPGKK